MNQEQLEDRSADWSESDKKWLASIQNDGLRRVAAHHGRNLFQITMQAGAATHALGVVARQGRGNRAIEQAIGLLQQVLLDLCNRALESKGGGQAFLACKADIELTAALSDTGQRAPGDRVSKGGIILDS